MASSARPLTIRWGKKLRRTFDRMIARFSVAPDAPVFDGRDFGWTAALRDDWRAIRAEAEQVLARPDDVPLLEEISPDHRRIAGTGNWRSFFLHGYGCRIEENIASCPRTAALVAKIPGSTAPSSRSSRQERTSQAIAASPRAC